MRPRSQRNHRHCSEPCLIESGFESDSELHARWSKLSAARELSPICDRTQFIIQRPFEGDDLLNHFSILKNVNPAEPGHGFGEVPADVLELVRNGQERIPVLLDATGTPLIRHIVHIDDVIHAIDRSLENEHAIGRDYNIAAAEAFQYREAAEYISEKLGIPTIEILNPQYHPFCIDISRARREIGYSPENDFHRMTDRAIEFRT